MREEGSPEPRPSAVTLPAEVLILILLRVEDTALPSCARVCRRWRELLSGQGFWRSLCQRRAAGLPEAQLSVWLQRVSVAPDYRRLFRSRFYRRPSGFTLVSILWSELPWEAPRRRPWAVAWEATRARELLLDLCLLLARPPMDTHLHLARRACLLGAPAPPALRIDAMTDPRPCLGALLRARGMAALPTHVLVCTSACLSFCGRPAWEAWDAQRHRLLSPPGSEGAGDPAKGNSTTGTGDSPHHALAEGDPRSPDDPGKGEDSHPHGPEDSIGDDDTGSPTQES